MTIAHAAANTPSESPGRPASLKSGVGGCAVVILAGPGPFNLWRTTELIRSLLRWEPQLGSCVIMDDAPRSRGIPELRFIPRSCKVVTIMNSLKGMTDVRGGQTAGVLSALAWIWSNTAAEFALKIDLDALVIAPFVEKVTACLARTPSAGVLGVFWSCNPSMKAPFDLNAEARLRRAYRSLYHPFSAADESFPLKADRTLVRRTSPAQLRAFEKIRPHVEAAISHGYLTAEDCQGGACVITREMIERMGSAGYLTDTDVWRALPFGDDQILAMYARAVGLELQDCRQPGDPFGVQTAELPYCLEDLVARGYSFIHSIKNDRRYSEAMIREFFATRARA